MRFALCNELYGTYDIYTVIDRAAELGYHGIELAPFTLTQDVQGYPVEEQKKLARYAGDRGIELMGLHWLLRAPEGLHLTSREPAVLKKTLDFFKKLIEISVNTGAKVLTLGSPQQRSYSAEDTKPEATERAVELFGKLTPELESEGLYLCLEPLESDFTNFITRTSEAVQIAETLGSPSIGITLDTHFLRWEKEEHGVDALQAFRVAGARLLHLHIQDENRRAPGMGHDDFREFIHAVREIRWKRYISMETFVSDDEQEAEEIARKGIRFLKKTFD